MQIYSGRVFSPNYLPEIHMKIYSGMDFSPNSLSEIHVKIYSMIISPK